MILKEVMPPREDSMALLLEAHARSKGRTRSEAILDMLHMVSGTDDARDGAPWFACSNEGRGPFPYDAFEGGEGFD